MAVTDDGKELSQSYLHPTSKADLVKACEEALIEQHNQRLQDEFQAWLRDDKIDGATLDLPLCLLLTSNLDMRRFYNLLSRLPDGLSNSSRTLKEWLTAVGTETVVEQSKVQS